MGPCLAARTNMGHSGLPRLPGTFYQLCVLFSSSRKTGDVFLGVRILPSLLQGLPPPHTHHVLRSSQHIDLPMRWEEGWGLGSVSGMLVL